MAGERLTLPQVLERAVACQNAGNLAEAERLCKLILDARPDHAEAWLTRATVLCGLKRYEEALAGFARVRKHGTVSARLLYLEGLALYELERPAEALERFDEVLKGNPVHPESHFFRGNALFRLGRFGEARQSFEQALAHKPDFADAALNRGLSAQRLNRHAEAIADLDKALALAAPTADALYGRGLSLENLNRWEEALETYRRALVLEPGHAKAQLARVMAQVPIVYRDAAEIAERRAAYAGALQAWCDTVDGMANAGEIAPAVGSRQPFYLAYQGENDRDLQAPYGARICRIMAERYAPVALAQPPRADEPIRVGFVSGYFSFHSNWRAPISGWLERLDRRKFRLFGYSTGSARDAMTERAARRCERFVEGPRSIEAWREAIAADSPHVLIYPEVGMDAVACQLAAQRLAPVQCNAWGHPDTSGFATLDYYLSSDLMEPPDADAHYTERLVRLPNLSVYYEPPVDVPDSASRQSLGLRPGATIYWSGQSLFKYLPQHDEAFCRIAREVSDCQFVFVGHQQGETVTDQVRARLAQAFSAHGLDAARHCVFLPRLNQQELTAAIGSCDVILDTIHWSGFNSILDTLVHNLPIVTMSGPMMRGRHATAILRMMEVTETIAASVDDYVAIAVRLARDEPFRRTVRQTISLHKHRVFRDEACIAGLEAFLIRAVRVR